MTDPTPLDLAALLDLLGFTDSEHYQLCNRRAGEPFHAVTLSNAVTWIDQDRDLWFGPNPVEQVLKGRPNAEQVTRLAALWVDLDVKAGGCASFDVARAIVDELAAIVGVRPVAVTYSGHGMQPIWAIDGGEIGDEFPRPQARSMLRRWGRLVAAVAERLGAKVDSLYDLPRILRCPGSVNHKQPQTPIPVTCWADTGAPITVEAVLEVLDEYGIVARPDDELDAGAIVSSPADWTPAAETCRYAEATIAGWKRDDPAARHPWLVGQAVRLAALTRAGCLDAAGLTRAADGLAARFMGLCARPDSQREPGPGEIADAFAWGRLRAAALPDDRLADELGKHVHGERPPIATRPLSIVPNLPTDGSSALAPDKGAPSLRSRSDHGNGHLLVDRYSDELRYVPSLAAWAVWNGHRWIVCDDNAEALYAAAETINALIPTVELDRKHRDASLSRRALDSMVALARSDPAMRAAAADLDADPYALNTPNGIVDLRTGAVRPCTPAELHTRATTVGYLPGADAPRWDAFLAETFADPTIAAYVQRLAGYSAAGVVTHHVLPFLYGSGGNGKSVLVDVLTRLLGDYASPAPPSFLAVSGRADESAIAALKGSRLVVASEVNHSDRFDEAKVKLLTGGDDLRARHLYARHFTFTPSHTLWITGNYQPRVDAGGDSFWRRLRLIPFLHTVPDEQRIEGLAAQLLEAEGPGILAWVVQGAIAALSPHGLADPESVLAATAQYRAEEDDFGRWVADCCRVGGGHLVKIDTRRVRASYEEWCHAESVQPLAPQTFGRELMRRLPIGRTRSHGDRYYSSLSLVERSRVPMGDDE